MGPPRRVAARLAAARHALPICITYPYPEIHHPGRAVPATGLPLACRSGAGHAQCTHHQSVGGQDSHRHGTALRWPARVGSTLPGQAWPIPPNLGPIDARTGRAAVPATAPIPRPDRWAAWAGCGGPRVAARGLGQALAGVAGGRFSTRSGRVRQRGNNSYKNSAVRALGTARRRATAATPRGRRFRLRMKAAIVVPPSGAFFPIHGQGPPFSLFSWAPPARAPLHRYSQSP